MKVSKILKIICIIILLISIYYIYDNRLWTFNPDAYFLNIRLHIYILLLGIMPTLYGISCILDEQETK